MKSVIESWLSQQGEYLADFILLGHQVAKVQHIPSGTYRKVKWASSSEELAFLKLEAIWEARLFRSHHAVEQHLVNGQRLFVFDYLIGESLSSLLKRHLDYSDELPDSMKKCLMTSLYQSLRSLHNCGAVHGDIKPSNIIINDGQAYLIDFATAGWLGRSFADKHYLAHTQSFSLLSSDRYSKYHVDLDWYGFFIILGLLKHQELFALVEESPRIFFERGLALLDNSDFSIEDRDFLKLRLLSIEQNAFIHSANLY